MINVGDVGKDYEHGVQLLKKLSEFRGTGDGVRKNVLKVMSVSLCVDCAKCFLFEKDAGVLSLH